MNTQSLMAGLLGCLLALGTMSADAAAASPRTVTDPQAPRALPTGSPVSVSWTDPAQFTEIRRSTNRWEAERGNWVQELAAFIRKTATPRLAPGQTLEVTITDIKRAGDYEPQHGPRARDIRIMKDIYPPRITLGYTLRDAQGNVLKENPEEKLVDMGYLGNSGLQRQSDALRYEKNMLDVWIRKTLPNR